MLFPGEGNQQQYYRQRLDKDQQRDGSILTHFISTVKSLFQRPERFFSTTAYLLCDLKHIDHIFTKKALLTIFMLLIQIIH